MNLVNESWVFKTGKMAILSVKSSPILFMSWKLLEKKVTQRKPIGSVAMKSISFTWIWLHIEYKEIGWNAAFAMFFLWQWQIYHSVTIQIFPAIAWFRFCKFAFLWFDICDALRDLLPFVQFKKRKKNPWRSVNFSRL